jgi:hypothetical protein
MPTSGPKPVTTLTTPAEMPASSTSFMNSRSDADGNSDGLTTIVLPAASAGASFHVVRNSGEFHGTIAATTPSGSQRVKLKMSGLSVGMTAPSILSARPP